MIGGAAFLSCFSFSVSSFFLLNGTFLLCSGSDGAVDFFSIIKMDDSLCWNVGSLLSIPNDASKNLPCGEIPGLKCFLCRISGSLTASFSWVTTGSVKKYLCFCAKYVRYVGATSFVCWWPSSLIGHFDCCACKIGHAGGALQTAHYNSSLFATSSSILS